MKPTTDPLLVSGVPQHFTVLEDVFPRELAGGFEPWQHRPWDSPLSQLKASEIP
jgi:hypothetical protein